MVVRSGCRRRRRAALPSAPLGMTWRVFAALFNGSSYKGCTESKHQQRRAAVGPPFALLPAARTAGRRFAAGIHQPTSGSNVFRHDKNATSTPGATGLSQGPDIEVALHHPNLIANQVNRERLGRTAMLSTRYAAGLPSRCDGNVNSR